MITTATIKTATKIASPITAPTTTVTLVALGGPADTWKKIVIISNTRSH